MDEKIKRLKTLEVLLTTKVLNAMQMGGVGLEDAEMVLKDLVEVSVLLREEELFDKLQKDLTVARG